MTNTSPTTDLDLLDLPGLINMLRGDVSYDDLEAAIGKRVSSQTLQRLGDRNRPYTDLLSLKTICGAADAINLATTQRTTPWALLTAHNVSLDRSGVIFGCPDDRTLARVALLAPGWDLLNVRRMAALNWITAAFVAEQAAEDAAKAPRARVSRSRAAR